MNKLSIVTTPFRPELLEELLPDFWTSSAIGLCLTDDRGTIQAVNAIALLPVSATVTLGGTVEIDGVWTVTVAGTPYAYTVKRSASVLLSGTPATGEAWQITVEGTTYSNTVLAGQSLATIASALTTSFNAAPVANAFSSSCNPTSLGDSRSAAIPEPTTAATRNPVPTSSATTRCRRPGLAAHCAVIPGCRLCQSCRGLVAWTIALCMPSAA